MKYKIIIFIIILLILFSFLIPKLLFEIEDFTIEKQTITVAKPESKIDVQAEKVYLVNAIHNINGGYMNLLVSEKEAVYYGNTDDYVEKAIPTEIVTSSNVKNKSKIQLLKNEIEKLESGKIIKGISAQMNFEEKEAAFMEKRYFSSDNEYEIEQFSWQNDEYGMKAEVENKTGKILYLSFSKDKLGTEIEKEEMLENYVKYLDLYIMDDWKFEQGVLQSEKAQLMALLIENQHNYTITIHDLGSSMAYYKAVEIAE